MVVASLVTPCVDQSQMNAQDDLVSVPSQDSTQAEVHCFLPGGHKCIASILLSPGWHRLSKIARDLNLRAPLLGLLPLDEQVTDIECNIEDQTVKLKAGRRYKTAIGAAPLIRFSTKDGQSRPHLCEEGLWLLRKISAPVYVAVFIGSGRCGKSTTCSALASVAEGRKCVDSEALACFPSAAQNEPVTAGADVAALPSSKKGGCLLIIDCEGSDNACSDDPQNSRALATIAFAFASHIVYCTGDSFKDSAINELGAAVATGELIQASREISFLPKVCFLMLKQNVEATQKAIESAFGEKEGKGNSSRNESRRAICEIACGLPDVRNLVNFEKQGNAELYEDAVKRFHNDLCKSSASEAGLQFTGTQLVDVLTELCQAVAQLGSLEPETACASIVRGHLQMIMKACIDDFEKALPVAERYQEERVLADLECELSQLALRSFDARTTKVGTKSPLLASMKAELRNDLKNHITAIYENKVWRPNTAYREKDELLQLRSQARFMTRALAAVLVLFSLLVFASMLVLTGIVSLSHDGNAEAVQKEFDAYKVNAAERIGDLEASLESKVEKYQTQLSLEIERLAATQKERNELSDIVSSLNERILLLQSTSASNGKPIPAQNAHECIPGVQGCTAQLYDADKSASTATTTSQISASLEEMSSTASPKMPPKSSASLGEALHTSQSVQTEEEVARDDSHSWYTDAWKSFGWSNEQWNPTSKSKQIGADATDDEGFWFTDAGNKTWNSFGWSNRAWNSFSLPDMAWPRRVWTPQQATTPLLCGLAAVVVVATGLASGA